MAPHLYATRGYAEALTSAEAVLAVPEWNAFVLRRPIDAHAADAGGVYPMTVLGFDPDLAGGLERLRALGLASVVLVPDPLLSPPPPALERGFGLCRRFKTHYLIDRGVGAFAPTKHHRDRIRRGHRRCAVEAARLSDHQAAWADLYAGLVGRRDIGGAADFQPAYFAHLAAEPTLVAFVARVAGEVVGMSLWFAADGVVYNHLTAVGPSGYAAGASYALYDAAIGHFDEPVINLGGGAGVGDGAGGLADFKRGFANAAIPSWLCGAILDEVVYAALSEDRPATDFFPAYRAPRT